MNDLRPGDAGTRIEHLIDLYELWEEGISTMEASERVHKTIEGKAQIYELKTALQLLWYQLTQDYNQYAYRTVINQLPKADTIVGGRGSPLKDTFHIT